MKSFALVFFLSVFCLVAGNVLSTHEDCLLSIDPGTCGKAYFAPVIFLRFAYDVETRKCVRLYYTGCSGNANNFVKKEECEEKCINYKRNSAPVVVDKVAEGKTKNMTKTYRPTHADCLLPPIVGICTITSNIFPSAETFSYIADRNECAAVLNVGCLNNANSFKTKADCMNICMNYKANLAPVEQKVAEYADCLLPIKSGTCYKGFYSLVLFTRYGYDVETRKCVRFYHTGCSGNANNFKTREECVNTCMDKKRNSAPLLEHKVPDGRMQVTIKSKRPIHADCLLPPITGICTTTTEFFPMGDTFAYIADMNICMSIINIGCLQNANSFTSPEDCISKCMS